MKGLNGTKNLYKLLVLILVFHFPIQTISENILHTKTPVVIYHGEEESKGTIKFENELDLRDNNFGYSMAFMNDLQSAKFWKTGLGRSVGTLGTLFIGAPNEKRLRNSGVVWGCQFIENGGLSCSIITSISNQDVNAPNQKCKGASTQPYPEGEEEQWIGSSMTVKDGNLFSCAPRLKLNGWRKESWSQCFQETAFLGGCYISESKDNANAKIPFVNIDVKHTQSNDDWFHLRSVYGFGFASHVSNVFPNSRLFIGSPSFKYWKGSFEEFRYREDRSVAYTSFAGNIQEVKDNVYMGYSLTSGKFSQDVYGKFVASGAPRAENLFGMVVIIVWSRPYSYKVVVGEQFGGYFGYSLASCDSNGDGKDELIVGAPFQSADIKSKDAYTTGCIYLYDVETVIHSRSPSPIAKICPDTLSSSGRVSSGARFGSAIANMGDINFDSFEDFVVGAPYDDDGVGSVFLYYGMPRVQSISAIKPQVIKGKMFEIPSLRGFGSNLFTGTHVDIDGNKTPDLAIGAHESRYVVVLRTRPVAKTEIDIAFHNGESQRKEMILKFLPTQKAIVVRTCVNHKFSVDVPQNLKLNTWVLMEIGLLDDSQNLIPAFQPPVLEKQHSFSLPYGCIEERYEVSETIPDDKEYSVAFRVSLLYNETNEIVEQLSRADIFLTTSQSSQDGQPISQSRNFENAFRRFNPYLPAPYTNFKNATVPVSKDDCEKDGNRECSPKLFFVSEVHLVDIKGQKSLLDVNMKSSSKPPIVGDLDKIIVTLRLKNDGETAYSPGMNLSLKATPNIDLKGLKFRWSHKSNRLRHCSDRMRDVGENKIRHNYDCSQPLHNENEIEFTWIMSNLGSLILKSGSQGLEGIFDFTVEAYPSNRKADASFQIKVKENVDIRVENSMSGTGLSPINPRTTNVDLVQFYVIKNNGISSTPFGSVVAEILIPTQVKIKGKLMKVIGVVDPSRLSGQDIQCEGDFFDPSVELSKGNSQANNSTSKILKPNRRRRSSNKGDNKGSPKLQVINPEAATLSTSDDDKIIKFRGCETDIGSKSCQKIICSTALQSKSSKEIRLPMYLLPSAKDELVEEYTLGVRIKSQLTVSYRDKKLATISGQTERKFVTQKGIPAYVYLLSFAGGTILFLLLTFALFKCGFFRRKTKEQLQQLKRQTMAATDMQNFQPPVVEQEEENTF